MKIDFRNTLSNNIVFTNAAVKNKISSKILDLYKNGKTQSEIAQELGIGEKYVSKSLRKRGVVTKITLNKIKKMIEEGMGLTQIATKLKVPISSVVSILEKYDLATKNQTLFNKIQKEDLLNLIKNGYSTMQIADIIGSDIMTVGRLYEKYGISTFEYSVNKAVKMYADKPSQETKINALNTVDNYLIIQAKNAALKDKSCIYEDYLQSLRLYFLEILERCKTRKTVPTRIIKLLKECVPSNEDKTYGKGDSLFYFVDFDKYYAPDKNITKFEQDDNNKAVVAKMLERMTEFHENITRLLLSGKSKSEIAVMYGITEERVRQIICSVITFYKERYTKITQIEETMDRIH